MTDLCPCCNHPIPPYLVEAELSAYQLRVFRSIAAAGTRGITIQSLIDRHFVPSYRRKSVTHHVSQMRHKLAKHSLCITSTGGSPFRYRLVPLTK